MMEKKTPPDHIINSSIVLLRYGTFRYETKERHEIYNRRNVACITIRNDLNMHTPYLIKSDDDLESGLVPIYSRVMMLMNMMSGLSLFSSLCLTG